MFIDMSALNVSQKMVGNKEKKCFLFLRSSEPFFQVHGISVWSATSVTRNVWEKRPKIKICCQIIARSQSYDRDLQRERFKFLQGNK
jgi:hypothetical protein